MKRSNLIVMAAGALLAVAGFVLILVNKETGGGRVPAFLAVGVGCGLFGHSLGLVLSEKAAHADPERARQIAVEQRDERNLALASRAKAKAFDSMVYIFGALMLVFALAGIPVWAVLALVAAYLLVVGLQIYYLAKYQREM